MSVSSPELPCSQACENNKGVILDLLQKVFSDRDQVLELGSGTGQHATWFAQHMPWLQWQPTDIPSNVSFSQPRLSAYVGKNLSEIKPLDVTDKPWRVAVPHALFTANSLHIMPYVAVQALFDALGKQAAADTCLVVYGPFNYGGGYSSLSNAQFDQWLAQQNQLSAIRDFEKVDALAQAAGFMLEQDNEMPANNRLLVWRKPG
ncbi:MAG: hypothetical protein ACI9DH_001153 [Halioglobus sp.]